MLSAPTRTADSNFTDRFGFLATQGNTGIQIFDANGSLL